MHFTCKHLALCRNFLQAKQTARENIRRWDVSWPSSRARQRKRLQRVKFNKIYPETIQLSPIQGQQNMAKGTTRAKGNFWSNKTCQASRVDNFILLVISRNITGSERQSQVKEQRMTCNWPHQMGYNFICRLVKRWRGPVPVERLTQSARAAGHLSTCECDLGGSSGRKVKRKKKRIWKCKWSLGNQLTLEQSILRIRKDEHFLVTEYQVSHFIKWPIIRRRRWRW